MKLDLDNSIALLARTPSALDALLRGLPEPWTSQNEGAGTMAPIDVIDHLAFLEGNNWMQRLELILEGDESRVFAPVNRQGRAGDGERSLPHLLDQFADLRTLNLEKLRGMNLQAGDLAKRARHPSFGPVTAAELLATWTAHDMTHLHQIARVLAHQYREAVGPWSRFLGVLHCEGHSEPA